MNTIWILAKLTFREAIRKRIMIAGFVLGVSFIVIYSTGLYFILAQVNSMVRSGSLSQGAENFINNESKNGFLLAGLYIVTFLSIAMATLLGADTLAGEINSGTIQTIVTKPIQRTQVVLGKWLGFASLLGLYVICMTGGVVLSMFIQTGYAPDNLLPGLCLIYLECLLIMTVTVMYSSAFPALATGGIVFGLYGISFIGGWIEQIGAALHNETAAKIGLATSLIFPSEPLWRRAAYEMQTPYAYVLGVSPFAATSVPSMFIVAYAFLYLAGTLFLAIRIFESRDL